MPHSVKIDRAKPAEEAADVINRHSVVKNRHCHKTEEALFEAEAEAEFGYRNDDEAFGVQERHRPQPQPQILEEEERDKPDEEEERHQAKTLSQLFEEEINNYDQNRILAQTEVSIEIENIEGESRIIPARYARPEVTELQVLWTASWVKRIRITLQLAIGGMAVLAAFLAMLNQRHKLSTRKLRAISKILLVISSVCGAIDILLAKWSRFNVVVSGISLSVLLFGIILIFCAPSNAFLGSLLAFSASIVLVLRYIAEKFCGY